MDTLTLKGLRFLGNHGYYELEREEGNQFEVDLVFSLDLREAGKTDRLNRTVDYGEAEKLVREVMEGQPLKLIETLTSRIGTRLFEHFKTAKSLVVRVRKLSPPLPTPADYSEVSMTWKR